MDYPNTNQRKIQHGVDPTSLDKRDFSFLRTFGASQTVELPKTFDLDSGLYPMPNQNIPNDFFGIPALPYGCTEYTGNELCTDEDKTPYNPYFTESKIHASQRGGIDMRTPLQSLCDDGALPKGYAVDFLADNEAKKHKRSAYFRVGQSPDYFDGFRKAMFSNNRSISIGTPWFGEWSSTGWGSNRLEHSGFMPVPDIKNISSLSWHCYKICGWIEKDGVPYLKCKPWLGDFFGDKGWIYLSREVLNAVMTILGTAAFTLAKVDPEEIKTVGMSYVFKFNLSYGNNDIEVAQLQKALQSLGYTIVHAVTPNYLRETKIALAKFQKDHDIVDDGTHFGPITRYTMNKILNPSQTLFGSIQLFLQTFF